MRDPLGFVDALLKEAETARNYTPILLEAASVIANLLLKNEEWQPPKLNSIEKALFDWRIELDGIANTLGEAELLAQLAEESAELTQAALKFRRVLDGINPTPVSEQDAQDNFHEEIADILLCLSTIGVDEQFIEHIIRRKAARWYGRVRSDDGEV